MRKSGPLYQAKHFFCWWIEKYDWSPDSSAEIEKGWVVKADTSQWVAVSRQPAGSGGATTEVVAHYLFRVVMDARPSGLEGVSYGPALNCDCRWPGTGF